MGKAQFGLTGLAVMGQNLVLNIEDHGFSIAIHNRTESKTKEFYEQSCQGRQVTPTYSVQEFVESIERPRKIMLMVKAGAATDAVIDELAPLLDEGDLLIDGGNALFTDTIRRNKELNAKGLLFIGTGVSGGEEGARFGPSIMPGGQQDAYKLVEPIFTKISAQVGGEPCCTYIGPDGAGHYVKMVHNGIEYGDMQLICEAYYIMANVLGMEPAEMSEVFGKWNSGDLESFLIEITADILSKTDSETGNPLVNMILDTAGQKGTGKWTSQNALDLGVPAPTIAEAVFARCISAIKDQRVAAADQLDGPKPAAYEGDKAELVEAIHDALYASKICSYAQGFQLMAEAGKEYGWELNFGEISMIWRGGCIIRAQFLQKIKDAYDRDPKLANLLLDPYFKEIVTKAQANWRKVVCLCAERGVPAPAFSSALAYYDSYRTARLPANLLQAQRDYFGAHTYERTDKPRGEFSHTEWMKI